MSSISFRRLPTGDIEQPRETEAPRSQGSVCCCCTRRAKPFHWPEAEEVHQHSDHLTLGISFHAVSEFLTAAEWPQRYCRSDEPKSVNCDAAQLLRDVDLKESGKVKNIQPGSLAQMVGIEEGFTLKTVDDQVYCRSILDSVRQTSAQCVWTFEGPEKWVTDGFGIRRAGKEVGYDVAAHLRKVFRRRRYHQFSLAEILLHLRHAGVGKAEVFLSHVQGELVATTLWAMRKCGADVLIFVDFFCLRQLQKDFDTQEIKEAIASIGRTVIVLDPVMNTIEQPPTFAPLVFERIFCVFEATATLHAQRSNPAVKLDAVLSLQGYLNMLPSLVGDINVAEAKSRDAEDKRQIMDFVNALGNDGRTGCEIVNESVTKAMMLAIVSEQAANINWLLRLLILIATPLLILSMCLVVSFSVGLNRDRIQLSQVKLLTINWLILVYMQQILETKRFPGANGRCGCSNAGGNVQCYWGVCLWPICVVLAKALSNNLVRANSATDVAMYSTLCVLLPHTFQLILPWVAWYQGMLRRCIQCIDVASDSDGMDFGWISLTALDLRTMAIFQLTLEAMPLRTVIYAPIFGQKFSFPFLLRVVADVLLVALAACPRTAGRMMLVAYIIVSVLWWVMADWADVWGIFTIIVPNMGLLHARHGVA